MIWAPPPPAGVSPPSYSLDEAKLLLTDLLPALRRYFLQVKEDVYRLPLKSLEFVKSGKKQAHYPPTFYFAQPASGRFTTAQYLDKENVHYLLSNCLGYDDPYADTLSWSTLEGSVAAVRGEAVYEDHYKPRYLLLPIVPGLANEKELGSDLDYIVDTLSLREHTSDLEAKNIFDKAENIVGKEAVDINTIEVVDTIVQKLEQQYDSLVNRTKEYLYKSIIMASVLHRLPLSTALMEAYPHRSLWSAMKTVPSYSVQLANSSKRIGTLLELLSTAIIDKERKRKRDMQALERDMQDLERERHDYINTQIRIFGLIIASAALLVFFPHFDLQAIFKIFGGEPMYMSYSGIPALIILIVVLFLLIWLVRIWLPLVQPFLMWLVRVPFPPDPLESKGPSNNNLNADYIIEAQDGRSRYLDKGPKSVLSSGQTDTELHRRKQTKDDATSKSGEHVALATGREILPKDFPCSKGLPKSKSSQDTHRSSSPNGTIKNLEVPKLRSDATQRSSKQECNQLKQKRDQFQCLVREFWELADYTDYKHRKERKEYSPLLSPAFDLQPSSWFEDLWKNQGPDGVDRKATGILQELWSSYLNCPFTTDDTILQMRMLQCLLHIFVLRPDRILLPRALCILRYKSYQSFGKPTISESEFCDSLVHVGFTSDQVNSLDKWLSKSGNRNQIKDHSVEKVAEALEKVGVKTDPTRDAANNWQGDLFPSH